MTAKLFEVALGIAAPWSVSAVEFDEAAKLLTVLVDFKPGTRFAISGHEGVHPVHDTVTKAYRHLNFFQHECRLQVRTPRVKLPNGPVRLAGWPRAIEPDFAGRLSGFTLLFEALILMLAQQMPFAAVARIVGESAHHVMAVCERYVEIALSLADFSDVTALAIDETSRARGHDYITLAADALARRVLFVTEGRDAKTIKALAEDLNAHGCPPEQIDSVSRGWPSSLLKFDSYRHFSLKRIVFGVWKISEIKNKSFVAHSERSRFLLDAKYIEFQQTARETPIYSSVLTTTRRVGTLMSHPQLFWLTYAQDDHDASTNEFLSSRIRRQEKAHPA